MFGLTLSLLPAILASFYSADATEASPVTLEFLRTSLQSQLESIETISATYSVSQNGTSAGETPIDTSLDLGPYDCEWKMAGSRFYLNVNCPTGEMDYRLYFDGQRGFTVDSNPQQAFPDVTIRDTPPDRMFLQLDLPTTPVGARVILAERPLYELMKAPTARLVDSELLGDVDCLKVVMPATDARSGTPLEVTALLDASHDYLPAQIIVRRLDIREHVWKWNVSEFLPLGAQATLRWLPKSASLQLRDGIQRMEVRSATINSEIDTLTFRPDLSSGAAVVDLTSSTPMLVKLTGAPHVVDRQIGNLAAQSQQLQQRSGNHETESAAPSGPASWRWLTLLSAGCIGTALLLWWRHNR